MNSESMKTRRTKMLVTLAMLSTVAYVSMLMVRISFIPAAAYLQYDPKSAIITIGGFLYGPLAAFAMSVTVAFLEMITVGKSGPIGFLMDVIASGAFSCTAAYVYKKRRTVVGASAGLILSVVVLTVVMLLWNYIVTPLYTNAPREMVVSMLMPVFLPFNLIKGVLNASITMIIYKPLKAALIKSHLLTGYDQSAERRKINIGPIIISVFVIITCILIIQIMRG